MTTHEEFFDQILCFVLKRAVGATGAEPIYVKFPGRRAQSALTVLWKRSELKLRGVYLVQSATTQDQKKQLQTAEEDKKCASLVSKMTFAASLAPKVV